MRTFDLNKPLTAAALNESLYKQFNVKINFDKYTREQLEDARNKYRTKISTQESGANFNDLLKNEAYQRDKFVLDVLNTRIKEMLGESVLAEKAVSKAQQKFMGMVHATQKGEKAPSKAVAKAAKGMSKKAAKDYASTKHKGLPAHVSEAGDEPAEPDSAAIAKKKAREAAARRRAEKEDDGYGWDVKEKPSAKPSSRKVAGKAYGGAKQKDDSVDEALTPAQKKVNDEHRKLQGARLRKSSFTTRELADFERRDKELTAKAKKAFAKTDESAKPDFLDVDKDGNKKETFKKAVKDKTMNKKVKEAAKPDFLDMDKDGNKKETMKKAVADKKKKAVKESKSELIHRAYQQFIAEGVASFLAEDEEGKAKSITAAADMVNDFTSWMQRVGNYQTKSMIELADNIRANFGMQEAETFKQSVGQALEGALNALTTAREEINNAVAVLAGEAPAVEPMGQDMGDAGMDMPAGEAPEAMPDDMNMPGDEFAASDAAAGGPETLGRMKRESIERGNRLMKILGA